MGIICSLSFISFIIAHQRMAMNCSITLPNAHSPMSPHSTDPTPSRCRLRRHHQSCLHNNLSPPSIELPSRPLCFIHIPPLLDVVHTLPW